MKKMSVFFVLLVLLTTACDKITDPIRIKGGLPGVVVDAQTNANIEAAAVTVNGYTIMSASNGRFYFFDVPRGDQVIRVTKQGYVSHEARIVVTDSTDLRIALVPQH
jgi:hypothetical protein